MKKRYPKHRTGVKHILVYLILLALWFPISGVKAVPTAYAIEYQKETTVYITKTGKKYHADGCRYLSRSKIKKSKKEAVKNGYGACKVCKP